MQKSNLQVDVPGLDAFEQVFSFVQNKTLKSNLAIHAQYAVFLSELEANFQIIGTAEYSIFKNIVQYTASVVEGVLHYGLEIALEKELVKAEDVMPKAESFLERKVLFVIDENTKIEGIRSSKKHEKFKKNTQFKTVCDAYKIGQLIQQNLLNDINDINALRDKRNKIHLAGLKQRDDYYLKADINTAFETMTNAIEAVRNLVVNS